MLFTTDKQTLDDLNIFGKHGGDTVFQIFNRTQTRGGAAVLEEMFRHPLSGEKAINRRSSIIRYFAQAGLAFPFGAELFDPIDTYLANTDERSRLDVTPASTVKKITSLVAMDGETAQIIKGIEALLTVFTTAAAFFSSLILPQEHAYEQEKQTVNELLSAPQWQPVWQSKGKLSREQLAGYDTLFRFRYRGQVLQLLQQLHRLDVYMAVAAVAVEHNYSFPVATAPAHHLLQLQNVYHPQVKGAVPNSLHITADGNVVFLTGANMAGKSTFMKSVSIALFLAHMGFPVPATAMEFTALDGIYTTINLPDNLGMGASHFYAEVLRVKKMAQELSQGKKLFIVFDELFRGTNVKDACEATIAVLEGFALQQHSVFIISTHIIEAGEVLKQTCPNISFCYLPTRMNGNKPVYTYRLETGITNDRHGMLIINNEGIPAMLEAGVKNTV